MKHTLFNCPSCYNEPLSVDNIILSSNDHYKLNYHCRKLDLKLSIEIDKYLPSLSKSCTINSCDYHPYDVGLFTRDNKKYLCLDCYLSELTSKQSPNKLKDIFCKKHKDKPIINNCTQCNIPVCIECISESHLNHCQWNHLSPNDLKSKDLLLQNLNDDFTKTHNTIKSINIIIDKLTKLKKEISQNHNHYLNKNLPLINFHELLYNDNSKFPNNDIIKILKALKVDDNTSNSKIFSKINSEISLITNAVEVIKNGLDFINKSPPLSFTQLKESKHQRINLSTSAIKSFKETEITLNDHTGTIYSLVQLSNGNFASSSADGTIKVYNSYSFELIFSIYAHTESVNIIKEIKDNVIASCSNDNSIKLWDLNKKSQTATIKQSSPVISIEPLGNDAIASFFGTMINVWNTTKQTLIYTREMPNTNFITKVFNNTFASSIDDNSIMIYDLFDKKNTSTYLIGHLDIVTAITPLQDDMLISGSYDQSIRIWDLTTQQCCYAFQEAHKYAISCLILLQDGRLASGSNDRMIMLWDLDLKESVTKLTGHQGVIRSLIQLSNGKLVSGSSDETIRVWN